MTYCFNDEGALLKIDFAVVVNPAHWAYAQEDDAAEAAWNAMTSKEQEAKIQADIASLYA
jgi:hypothetical protein